MNRRKRTRGSSGSRFGMAGAFLIVAVAVALFCGGCANKPRVFRIGILVGYDTVDNAIEAYRNRMGELGYVEGKNVVYDVERSHADPSEEKRIAARFVADRVDLVFVIPGPAARTMKAAARGTGISIVFAYGMIEGTDLVDSVRQPGGNITGVRIPAADLVLKTLESLLQIKPQARRIMVIYDPSFPTNPLRIEALRAAAASLKVTLREVTIARVQDTEAILEGLEKSGEATMDAVMFLPDPIPASPEATSLILKFADAHRVPIVGGPATLLRSGGSVISAATDVLEQARAAASLSDRILRGTPAGTIPLVSTEPQLYINYRKARELGLTVPQGLLKQASEIIQ